MTQSKPEIPCKQCPCYHWPTVFEPRFSNHHKKPTRRKTLDLLLIGEAPGTEEIIMQSPFVGPAGRLLQLFLKTAKLDFLLIGITNACRCSKGSAVEFKPPQEAFDLCTFNLIQEIKAYRPKNIIALGAFAINALVVAEPEFFKQASQISSKLAVTKLDWNRFVISKSQTTKRKLQIIPTVHPSYILRQGSCDLQTIIESRWSTLSTILI